MGFILAHQVRFECDHCKAITWLDLSEGEAQAFLNFEIPRIPDRWFITDAGDFLCRDCRRLEVQLIIRELKNA